MKKFTKLTLFSIAIIMLLQVFIPTISYAVEIITLNIQSERPYSDDDGDGITGNDVYTVERDATQTVFKIGEKTKKSLDFNSSYYCLRAGLGFGSTNAIMVGGVDYEKLADLTADSTSENAIKIQKYYKNIIGYQDFSTSNYNSICWIADNMYLPKAIFDSDEINNKKILDNIKKEMLEKAGIAAEKSQLTDDDIEVIQQMALWYFANNDSLTDSNSLALPDSIELANLLQINSMQPTNNIEKSYNKIRADQINKLYKYFIDNAKIKGNTFFEEKDLKIEFANSNPSINEDMSQTPEGEEQLYNYLIGPYKLNILQKGNIVFDKENEFNLIYGINGVNNSDNNIEIVDQSGKIITNEDILKGTEFNIKIQGRKAKITKFNLKLAYSYSFYNTTASIWTATIDGNPQQPVLKVEKTKQDIEGSDHLEVNTGYYRVQLLKIDDSEEKTPLAGAKFIINNGATILTDAEGTFTTPEIKISSEGTQTLEIVEEEAPEGYEKLIDAINLLITTGKTKIGYSITNISKPENENVTVELHGNTIIITIKNKKIKDFDLSLRKYITSVSKDVNFSAETTATYNRTPDVDTSKLNTVGNDNKEITTATYTHSKEPIYLSIGDYILYTVRVYNEGEVDGYVKEITDHLPEELDFVNCDANKDWTYDANTRKVTTTALSSTLIPAFDSEIDKGLGEGLSFTDVQIVCRVNENAKPNKEIVNIAEISEYSNEFDILDRDSKEPANLTDYDLKEENSTYQEDDDDFERVKILTGGYNVKLQKVDSKTKEKVSGAIFTIEGPEGTSTDVNLGEIELKDIKITNTNTHTYNITEKTAPKGYKKLNGTITLEITPKLQNNEYVVTKDCISVTGGEGYAEIDINENTHTITITIENDPIEGQYDVVLVKEDETGKQLDSKATFEINGEEKEVTGILTIADDVKITAENVEKADVYTIKETKAPDGYCEFDGTIEVTVAKKEENEVYKAEEPSYKVTDKEGKDITESSKDSVNVYLKDGNIYVEVRDEEEVFDLSLRKFISHVERKGDALKFDSREPVVHANTLTEGIKNESGEIEYTATYEHPKNTLTLKQGDIVTYTIRVYNEGEVDGFVNEITDYIPRGLGLLCENNIPIGANWLIAEGQDISELEFVGENGWYKSKENVPTTGLLNDKNLDDITIVYRTDNEKLVIKDNSLKDELISKYNVENDVLDYKDIEVTCVVLVPNTYKETITNIAEISECSNIYNIPDRDSTPENADLENYELQEKNSTYQEDDDDYESIDVKYFDLALRKFITGVNEEEITNREPIYKDENGKIVKNKDGNIQYNHSKEPVEVVDKDIVTYTLRVFNEGTITGFAEEIEDDIPKGLIFLPDNKTNQEYGWKMYRPAKKDENLEGKDVIIRNNEKYVLTEDAKEATIIRTDFLSEVKGQVNEETGINSNLLKSFNGKILDYRDVKVAFKVSQYDIPEENVDRIIINKAHITKDSDDDEDSIPNEWNNAEDDQDIEKVYVQEFDLALFKWVSQTTVAVDGKTTITETGFKPNVGKTEAPYKEDDSYRDNKDNEPIASVTIDKKKLSKTIVKFTYNIKVVNEGDIPGYAKVVTDYIPEGLEFIAEDNPLWTIGEKDGTISTKALEKVLLKPGEGATVPVVFTWINNENNLGIKNNIAAITEDYNDKNVGDVDSTPGNEDMSKYDKEQEDDDDFALVILTLKTGNAMSYLGITLVFVTIIAAGTIAIKKYVL